METHLEFELIDKQHIKVIVVEEKQIDMPALDDKVAYSFDKEVRHEVGNIHAPSMNGIASVKNMSIQICGFSEAFDLWGCGMYQTPKLDQTGTQFERTIVEYGESIVVDKENRIILDNDGVPKLKPYIKQEGGELIWEQTKDIQLMFRAETKEGATNNHSIRDCLKCFNKPCTCEIHIKGENPYTVKCESDLELKVNK